MPLTNCKVEHDLLRTNNFVLVEDNNNLTDISFKTTSTKLYVPVVTLSIGNNIKFFENLNQGFKGTVSWNNRSEVTTQTKSNNLDYMIEPAFRNINRLFVLSFKNGDNDPIRDCFGKYYMPLVEIKDFNALINNKTFLINLLKSKQEAYGKLVEMSRKDYYTAGNYL